MLTVRERKREAGRALEKDWRIWILASLVYMLICALTIGVPSGSISLPVPQKKSHLPV